MKRIVKTESPLILRAKKKNNPEDRALEAAVMATLGELPSGAEFWIAVSGGIDSVVLLHTVERIQRAGKLKNLRRLGVLHVNHNLRGRESKGDAEFVRSLCKKLGLTLKSTQIRWARGEKRAQLECRLKREAFFEQVVRESEDPKRSFVVLAHHSDDQAETIFLRLLRGTGLRGLAGMAMRDGYKLRPFLSITHSQIQSSAAFRGITWREDSSNRESKYERNWVRQKIFPLLEERRPGVARRLSALAAEARKLPEWMEIPPPEKPNLLRELAENSLRGAQLFRATDFAGGAAAEAFLSHTFGLERKHVAFLLRLLEKGNGKAMLPGKLFWISCGYVLVVRGSLRPNFVGRARGAAWQSVLGKWQAPGKKLRPWRAGDGHSLKKRLLNARVPEFFRGAVPVVEAEKPELLLPFAKGIRFEPSPLAKRIFGRA